MCGVWVALEDIDMDCGPLVYYPGSHKLPEVTLTDIGVTADASNYPKYEDYIENLIEDRVAEMLGKASVSEQRPCRSDLTSVPTSTRPASTTSSIE